MDARGDDESVFVYDELHAAPNNVTHIRVDPSVTIIPEGAFGNRLYLLEVELPEGVTKIENNAFRTCKSLMSINLPSTLQEIGEDAFEICEKLEDIVLPTGLRTLGQYSFNECRSLKSIHIPPNVKMDNDVFVDCSGLTKVTFSEGFESIGKWSFMGCNSLVSVKLPSSLKIIEEGAFCRCERLSDMNLPDAVETIQVYAFSGTSMHKFRIPPLVTVVNINMFNECLFLVSVELSANVRNINNDEGDDDAILLNKLRNIALPRECTLSEDVDILEICKDLRVVFPDGDSNTIPNALRHRFDNLPIHKICYYQSYHPQETVLGDLKLEINPWTSKFPGQLKSTGKQRDCLGMTPLHILACSTRQDVEVYRLLIGKYPETLITKDKWGDIPILYAFWCNVPVEVIELLVESYKTKHPDYEFDWRGMLQTLSDARVPLTNIQKLVSTQQMNFPDQKIQDMKTLVMALAISDTENALLFKQGKWGYKPIIPTETFKYLLRTSITKRLDILQYMLIWTCTNWQKRRPLYSNLLCGG